MVQVKDLTELTVRDLWQEVKGEDEWWGDLKGQTLGQVKRLLESAMEKVLPEGEDRIRTHVAFMDKIECAMMEGIDYLPANRLGDMEISKTHLRDLEDEYFRWANRLAGQMGVPLYLYAEKFQSARGRRGGMIPRG